MMQRDRQALTLALGQRPLRQGRFDNLCSIYATINAMRLSAHFVRPMTIAHCRTLFQAGIDWLVLNNLLEQTIEAGLEMEPWFALTEHLVDMANNQLGLKFKIKRPFVHTPKCSLAMLQQTISEALNRQRPCVLLLDDSYAHYSVVMGITDTRLELYDSIGFQWINWASCRTQEDSDGTRHYLVPESLTLWVILG